MDKFDIAVWAIYLLLAWEVGFNLFTLVLGACILGVVMKAIKKYSPAIAEIVQQAKSTRRQ